MTKDKLEHIFEMQSAFDNKVVTERRLSYDFSTWMQKEVLAIISELAELLNEVNFKWWKNPKKVDTNAVKEELVDILHFLISACIKAGFSADDIYLAYLEKNRENFLRQEGKSAKQGYASNG